MLTSGDLSPDLERCVEAMARAICNARHERKRIRSRVLPTLSDDDIDDAEAALRAALAVRAQCGTCGGTGDAVGWMAESDRESCPTCGGMGDGPLEVLVPSARLEQVGWWDSSPECPRYLRLFEPDEANTPTDSWAPVYRLVPAPSKGDPSDGVDEA
jgi:hypothetical protein